MLYRILWISLFLPTSFAITCPSRCDCMTTSYGEEITCSNNETHQAFKINYNDRQTIIFQCLLNPVQFHEGMFQQFSFGIIDSCKFRDCHIPLIPFSAILKGINVTRLQFQGDNEENETAFPTASFQDMNHLKRLQISGTHFHTLPDNLFESLTNLKELILQNNLLTHLPPNVFIFLKNLITLDLSVNSLQILESQIQWPPSLNNLYLHANQFKTLPTDVFAGLTHLEVLDLQDNLIQTLPATVFDPLIKLQELKLFNNNFQNISQDLFTKNTLLVEVDLHSNPELETLPSDIFQNLLLLKTINLSQCNLKSLSSTLFSGLVNLETIDLSQNAIQSLSETIFHNCKSLAEIFLSNNNLSLPELIFQNLSNLKRLHISHNSIYFLPDRIFFDLILLEELDLSFNHLSSIHSVFNKLQNLHKLNLQHNNIDSIDQFAFSQCNRLQKLDLSKNHLHTAQFFLPPALSVIKLSHNFLTEMPMNFQAILMFLKLIDLSDNFITTIFLESVHSVADDVVINLQNNNITKIDFTNSELFSSNSQIHKSNIIQLMNNPISCDCQLESFLKQLRKQKEGQATPFLVDTENLICAAPSQLKNREIISLSEKDLICNIDDLCPSNCTCIEHAIDRMREMKCHGLLKIPSYAPSNVTNLDLSNNNLSSTEGINALHWKNITTLNLTNNHIDTLDSHLLPTALKNLYLQDNKLQLLSKDDIQKLSTGLQIWLGSNPWICDCKTNYFSEWLENASNVQDRNQMQCYNVPNITVRNFLCLKPLDKSSLITVIVGMSLVALLATSSAIIFYKYQEEMKVWLYSRSLCLSFLSRDDLDSDKVYDAFISFSQDDIEWVSKELVPELEQKEPYFRLCIHHRDWLVGEWIPNQIIRSVEISRRTIVILSKNFLSSIWGHLEFKTAHYQALEDRMNRLIVIVLGDLPPIEEMDAEIRTYVSLRTYLHWKDPWFWEKLRYAMPHRRNISSSSPSHQYQNRGFSQVEVSSV